jgi:hypothetical protein
LALECLEKLKCGQITNLPESRFFRPITPDGPAYDRKEPWSIIGCNMQTSVHAVVQFTNPRYKAAAILPDIDYCGKYFAVGESPDISRFTTKTRT